MKDTSDDRNEARADWIQHSYTQTWAEEFRSKALKARGALNAACSQSTDPAVRAAYVEWLQKETISEWMRTGVAK